MAGGGVEALLVDAGSRREPDPMRIPLMLDTAKAEIRSGFVPIRNALRKSGAGWGIRPASRLLGSRIQRPLQALVVLPLIARPTTAPAPHQIGARCPFQAVVQGAARRAPADLR